ncbi:MAG: hypothetical protein RIR49_546 [Actinomycetota bacterium]
MSRVFPLGRGLSLIAAAIGLSGLLTACGDDTAPVQPPVTSLAADPAATLPVATTILVDGIPDDVPTVAVPDGASTSGIVASNGTTGSSVVEFSLSGDVDRELLSTGVRTALEGEGWVFVERSYDTTTMRMIFETADGATILTWVLVTSDGSAAGSVTVIGA